MSPETILKLLTKEADQARELLERVESGQKEMTELQIKGLKLRIKIALDFIKNGGKK